MAIRDRRSAARLAVIFREEDLETEARLGGPLTVAYRFQCKHCRSRFSLAQELERHEKDCGEAGVKRKAASADSAAREIGCKRCRAVGVEAIFPAIKDLMRHVRAEHAEDFKRAHEAGIRRRQVKEKEAGRARAPEAADKAPAPSPRRPRKPAPAAPTSDMICPLCASAVPAATAQLVQELQAAGIPKSQAFEAAKIARRVLAQTTA